jgi:hypothetical protein
MFPNAATNQFCAQCGASLAATTFSPGIKLLLGMLGLIAVGGILLTVVVARLDHREQSAPAQTRQSTTPNTPAQITRSAFFADPAGDVRDGNHQKPSLKLPGADLIKTTVETVGPDLTITFTTDGNFQAAIPSGQSAVWTVTACNQEGNGCCILGAKQMGGEWLTYLFEMSTSRNSYLSKPAVSGNRLTVTARLEELPATMRGAFRWSARSEWDGRWRDRVPDEGGEWLNPPTVPFPQP